MSKKEKDDTLEEFDSLDDAQQFLEELTPEQYETLNNQVEEFHISFLSFLAGTSKYEIVPTMDENGNYLSVHNLDLIRRESKRLGFKVLYSVECGNNTLIINPENLKTGVISNSVEIH